MQLLNVALGGTLVQHLDGHVEDAGVFGHHEVTPVPGTRYAAVVPEECVVPTYHHQAVDRLGDGLLVSRARGGRHGGGGRTPGSRPGRWGSSGTRRWATTCGVMSGLVAAAS